MTSPSVSTASTRLRVFISYSSPDRTAAQTLYNRLRSDGCVPWLDKEDLLPGQKWQLEIRKAVRNADVVLVCLSKHSTTRAGFVHREIKFALDVADEQPEGTIFLIPVRLEECDVPERLREWQWVDLFEQDGYDRLLRALRAREDGNSPPMPATPSSSVPFSSGSSIDGGGATGSGTGQVSPSSGSTSPAASLTTGPHFRRFFLIANRILLILCIAAAFIAVLLLFTDIADAVVAVIGVIAALVISLFRGVKEIPEKQWFSHRGISAILLLLLAIIGGLDAYLSLRPRSNPSANPSTSMTTSTPGNTPVSATATISATATVDKIRDQPGGQLTLIEFTFYPETRLLQLYLCVEAKYYRLKAEEIHPNPAVHYDNPYTVTDRCGKKNAVINMNVGDVEEVSIGVSDDIQNFPTLRVYRITRTENGIEGGLVRVEEGQIIPRTVPPEVTPTPTKQTD